MKVIIRKLEIRGVGQQKLNDFGDVFLKAIVDYTDETGVIPLRIHKEKKNKNFSGTYRETIELISQRNFIKKTAETRGLKESTIMAHIKKAIDAGEKINLDFPTLLGEKFNKIKIGFEKFGIKRLATIFNFFDGQFSYDEIRLARIIIKSIK